MIEIDPFKAAVDAAFQVYDRLAASNEAGRNTRVVPYRDFLSALDKLLADWEPVAEKLGVKPSWTEDVDPESVRWRSDAEEVDPEAAYQAVVASRLPERVIEATKKNIAVQQVGSAEAKQAANDVFASLSNASAIRTALDRKPLDEAALRAQRLMSEGGVPYEINVRGVDQALRTATRQFSDTAVREAPKGRGPDAGFREPVGAG